MGYQEEWWKSSHVLCQRHDQSVQDYTTDFRHQALVLGISFDDLQFFHKYTVGLQERIDDELRLYSVRNIVWVS